MLILKRKKISAITSSPKLLTIEPREIRVPRFVTISLLMSISIGYFLLLANTFQNRLAMSASFFYQVVSIYSIAYVIILLAIILLGNKATPFVITEKGIAKIPMVAELWEDIEGYAWETFKGGTRIPFAPKEGVVSLYIINKGGWMRQRNIEGRFGHTVLVNYGIYFNPEQVAATEKIFGDRGIRKFGSSKEALEHSFDKTW